MVNPGQPPHQRQPGGVERPLVEPGVDVESAAVAAAWTVLGGVPVSAEEQERQRIAEHWAGIISAGTAAVRNKAAAPSARTVVPRQGPSAVGTHIGFDRVPPVLYERERHFVDADSPAYEENVGYMSSDNMDALSDLAGSEGSRRPVRDIILIALDRVTFDISEEYRVASGDDNAEARFLRAQSGFVVIREGVKRCMQPEGEEREIFELDGVVYEVIPHVEEFHERQQQIDGHRKYVRDNKRRDPSWEPDETVAQAHGDRIAQQLELSRRIEALFTALEDPAERAAVEVGLRMKTLRIDSVRRHHGQKGMYADLDSLFRGSKLDSASYLALARGLNAHRNNPDSRYRHLTPRRSTIDEDLEGIDAFIGDQGVDFKAEGTFNVGVQDGAYRPIPGLDPAKFAYKEIDRKIEGRTVRQRVLVINSERNDMGGGLSSEYTMNIPRDHKDAIYDWKFNDEHRFAETVLPVILELPQLFRAMDEAARQP